MYKMKGLIIKLASILIISVSIAAVITIASHLFDKQIHLPSYISVNLSQESMQRFKYYYDVGDGINEKHSTYAWPGHRGKSMGFIAWFDTPSQLRLDLGDRKGEKFKIESICIRNLLRAECKLPSEYQDTIRPLHHIGSFDYKDGSLEVGTSGDDPYIYLGQQLMSDVSRASILGIKATFAAIALFFLTAFTTVALFVNALLNRAPLNQLNQLTYIGIIFCGLFLIFCYHFSLWSYMGVPNLPVHGIAKAFADLHGVLAPSDCFQLGFDVYLSNPCDQWERVHAYGSPWLGLGYIGINNKDLIVFAITINALFLIMSFIIINPSNTVEYAAACALILSPAVLLGFERANVDLLLFVVLCFAGVIAANFRILVNQLIASFVIACATILKIYPLFSFFALLIRQTNITFMLWIIILFFSMISVWYYTHPLELGYIFGANPVPHDSLVFGGGKLFYLLFNSEEYNVALTLATITSVLVGYFISRNISNLGDIGNRDINLYLIGVSILAGAFYFTTNYDYRCIFLVMCLPALLKMRVLPSVNERTRLITNSSIILAVYVAWAEFPLISGHIVTEYTEQIISWVLLTSMVSIGIAMLRQDKLSVLTKFRSNLY